MSLSLKPSLNLSKSLQHSSLLPFSTIELRCNIFVLIVWLQRQKSWLTGLLKFCSSQLMNLMFILKEGYFEVKVFFGGKIVSKIFKNEIDFLGA